MTDGARSGPQEYPIPRRASPNSESASRTRYSGVGEMMHEKLTRSDRDAEDSEGGGGRMLQAELDAEISAELLDEPADQHPGVDYVLVKEPVDACFAMVLRTW